MDDKNSIKDRILKDVGKSIKLIQQLSVGIESCENNGSGGGSGGAVNSNSWLIHSLCCHLDLAFRHGLREPSQGFWPLLHGLSHSDTFQVIDGLQNICSPLGKGLVWLHHTLMEGSLQSYISCLIRDTTTLRNYYTSKAIFRDPACTQQLLTLLAGLENISFNMNADGTDWQEASGFSGLTSMTSSISSPVDSGVALLDSDADVTSTNEATVTEGDSASLREEVAMLPELEDNLINDHIVSQEMIKNKVVMEISDMTKNIENQIAVPPVDLLEDENFSEELDGSLKCKFMNETSNHYPSAKCSVSEFILPVESASAFDQDSGMQKEISIDTQLQGSSNNTGSSNCMNNPDYNSCNTSHPAKSCSLKQFNTNRMAESCMALIEGRNESVCLESCKSEDSLNDNKWSHDSDVMSKSVGTDATVIRRQRKKKRNGPDVKVKRVSFHEDLLVHSADMTSGFSASFLPPNPVIKCDVVKGRYSWCGEGDAPFFEQRKNENDTKSDVFLSTSIGKNITGSDGSIFTDRDNFKCKPENKTCSEVTESMNLANSKLASSRGSLIDAKLPPVTERGTPEGQEDPPKTSSLLHLNSITDSVLKKFPSIASSIDWSSDTESDVCDHQMNIKSGLASQREDRRVSSRCQSALLKFSNFMSPSKTSLLKRFMKSVTEKKNFQRKLKLHKIKPLYIPGAKPDPVIAGQCLVELENIYSSVNVFAKSGCIVGTTFERSMKNHIFFNSKEVVYRVFKVNSSYFIDGKSEPLLIVLSEFGIYFVGLQSNMSICLRVMMRYDELETVIVGPCQQTLMFVGSNNTKRMLITSSNRIVSGEIVAHIEIAMRRSLIKYALPAVVQLELDNMKTLKLQLSKDFVLLSDERLHHYSIVHLQDNPTSPPSTPLGPKKEGHLMFRPATTAPWEPGYFILKGGVVYMFSDQGTRLPQNAIQLHSGQCHGCRRIPQESRPHTFEIILGHKRSFQFAAADEYETSEWLQALVQSASGFYEMEQINTTPCSLIITSHHIIACQETFPSGSVSVVTCAGIVDLVAISLVSTDDSWCVLEFACHEVHESSGDWAVYFSNSYEMLSFKQDLERQWRKLTEEEFPLQSITSTPLQQRCEETSLYLSAAWDEILLADH